MISTFRKILLCAAVLMPSMVSGQNVIHYWNFNTAAPASPAQWPASIAADQGTGTISFSVTNMTSFAGTTLNGIAVTEVAGGSLVPVDMANNGKNIVLSVPTTNFGSIKLSYATRGTSSGFSDHVIGYSIDGQNFVDLTTITGRNNTSFSLQTVDFSTITGLNDNPLAKIRITLNGATSGTGNNRIDNIQVTGLSTATGEPTVAASSPAAPSIFGTVAKLTFTKGNGVNRLVLMQAGSTVSESPVDGTEYSANSQFGSGSLIGSASYVVYNGNGSDFEVSGLTPESNYAIKIFESNGSGTGTNYLITDAPSFEFGTGVLQLSNTFEGGSMGDYVAISAASNRNWVVLTGEGASTSTKFAEANGFGGDVPSDDWLVSPAIDAASYINPKLKFALQAAFTDAIPGFSVHFQTVSNATSAVSTNPADWTELSVALPSADNFWEVRELELSGVPSSGFFRYAFRYQSSGTAGSTSKRFRLDNIELENGVALVRPTTGASSFAIVNVTASSGQASFTPGNGARRIVLMKEGSAPTEIPQDGTGYTASETFGTGTKLGENTFVVADGAITGFTVFGLKPLTTYNFTVYEYNGAGASSLYLTDVSFNGTSIITKENTGGGGSVAVDLFFSEYLEGYSNNKAFEIFNGTGRDIDLSNYRVNGRNNGTDVITILTWPSGTMLANNGIRVVVDGAASDTLKAKASDVLPVIPQNSTVRYATSFNGNDYRSLEKNVGGTWTTIDLMGSMEVPAPSVAWDVAGIAAATVNRTLVRKSYVNKGNTDWTMSAGTSVDNSEWDVLSFNNSSNTGLHTFNPDALVDPFDFVATINGLTSLRLTWRLNGAGHNVLVVMSADQTFTTPVNGTTYAVNETLEGDTILIAGSETSVDVASLASGTAYYFKIYSFNDLKSYSPGKSVSATTAKGEPSAHVTAFAVNSFTGSSLAFAWTDGTGSVLADGYLVALSKDGAAAIVNPVDGTEPSDGNLVKKVARGVQSVSFTGLENNVTYSAKIFPYSNRASLINFKTDGTVPTAQGTTNGTSLQEAIGGALKGTELVTLLRNDYRVTSSQGYDQAREKMYSNLDLTSLDSLSCVYTGYSIKINRASGGRTQAAAGSINAEHTWPQSKGAENEPMRSDIHHLFPSWENVNSARGNLPFAEIPDNQTSTWWGRKTVGGLTAAPAVNVRDLYSELRSGTNFEPREDHKGNVARAIFYFWMRYQNDAIVSSNQSFFEDMKETLYRWHYQDLPDEREVKRSNDVAGVQGNRNPFVHDTTLVRRAFFPQIGDAPSNSFTVATPSLVFGPRRTGRPDTLFVFIQNQSTTTALNLSNIRVEGTGASAYSVVGSLVSIAASRTGQIAVVFNPANRVQYNATLRFDTNFEPAAASVTLSGSGGMFAFELRPSVLEFDPTTPQENVRQFRFVNTGETIATVNRILLSPRIFQFGRIIAEDLTFPIDLLAGDSLVFDLEMDVTKLLATEADTMFVQVDGDKLPQFIIVRQKQTTSLDERTEVKAFSLLQNFPNPFNPTTQIGFELPVSSKVTLEVYNLTGQKVAVLANGTYQSGRHNVTFDAQGLASGLYIYRITTEGFTATRKLILLK